MHCRLQLPQLQGLAKPLQGALPCMRHHETAVASQGRVNSPWLRRMDADVPLHLF